MVRRQLYVGLVVALVALSTSGAAVNPALAQQTSDEQTQIDSCTTISEPGQYTLTTDIENATGTCIEIRASDVTLDGDGHLVDGVQNESTVDSWVNASYEEGTEPSNPEWNNVGIAVDASTSLENVTVTDVRIQEFFFGTIYRDVSGGTISEVSVTNAGSGVEIYDASGLTVTDNQLVGNRWGLFSDNLSDSSVTGTIARENAEYTLDFVSPTDLSISNNTVTANGIRGISIEEGTSTAIRNNTVTDTADTGVFVASNSTGSTISNNTVERNFVGILSVGNVENQTISDNTLANNTFIGIVVDDGSEISVSNNSVSESGYVGINFANSQGSTLSGNDVSNTRGTSPFDVPFPSAGYLFSNASSTVVDDNDASGTNATGIVVRDGSRNNVLLRNQAEENAEDGILITESESVVLVVNTAVDNGDDGIDLTNSNWTVLQLNALAGNGDQAIEVNNSENVLQFDDAGPLRDEADNSSMAGTTSGE